MCEKEEINCIHCGDNWEIEEVKDYIEIESDGIKLTDFFCPGCSKIMNGYTNFKYIEG